MAGKHSNKNKVSRGDRSAILSAIDAQRGYLPSGRHGSAEPNKSDIAEAQKFLYETNKASSNKGFAKKMPPRGANAPQDRASNPDRKAGM
jgi:hypothetical protein